MVTTNRGTWNNRPGWLPRYLAWAIRCAAFARWIRALRRLASRFSAQRPWCQARASRTGISNPPRTYAR